jgi:hypothetical protein
MVPLDHPSLAELARDQDRGAAVKAPHMTLLREWAGNFDADARPGPSPLWAGRVGNRELDPEEGHRTAARAPALAGSGGQLSGEDRIVQR